MAYIGQETLPWLTTDWVLSQFGRRLKNARARYGEFVRLGIKEGHRQEFHEGTSGGGYLETTVLSREYMRNQNSAKTNQKPWMK
jgi:putative transposase